IDHFIDEMVQPVWSGRADVHRRALSYGLETLENLDMFSAVIAFSSNGLRLVFAPRIFHLFSHLLPPGTSVADVRCVSIFSVECSERQNARSGQINKGYFNKNRADFRQETFVEDIP